MSPIRKLLVHFTHFVSGNTLLLLLGFVTFPILTRLLSREEYGVLGLVTNTVALAVALAKGGLSDSIVRLYRDYADTPERLTLFTSTVVVRSVVLTAFVVTVYLVGLPRIIEVIDIDPRYYACFVVMAFYLLVRPSTIIVLNYLRTLGKTFLYNAVNVGTKAGGILLAFAIYLWVIDELYGYFLGIALAEVTAMIVLYRWLLSAYRVSIKAVSGPLTVDLVKFGLPLMMTELSYLLLFFSDRYLITAFHGPDLLGLYSVGYNLPSYINDIVMFSLAYAIVPMYTQLYTREGRQATEAFLSRSMNYYLMAMIPVCLGYAAVAQDVIVILASHKYAEAAIFSPIILAGLAFCGMNSIVYAGLYLEKKTGQILAVMLGSVVVSVAVNLILLPRFGAIGAASANLAACGFSTLMMAILSRRYLRIRASVGNIVYYTAVSILMYVCLSWIETSSPWVNLLAKVPAGVAIVALAALWREPELRQIARRLLTTMRTGAS